MTTPDPSRSTGALGLPYTVAGDMIQSVARALVDRGYDQLAVTLRLQQWANEGGEADWWDTWGGPCVDDLGRRLGFDYEPDEES